MLEDLDQLPGRVVDVAGLVERQVQVEGMRQPALLGRRHLQAKDPVQVLPRLMAPLLIDGAHRKPDMLWLANDNDRVSLIHLR